MFDPLPEFDEPALPRPTASRSRLDWIAPIAALLCVALGTIVLVSWSAGRGSIEQLIAGLPSMKPNAAVGLIFAGLGLFALARGTHHRVWSGLALVCGSAAAALGALTLSQDIFSYRLGIDQILFLERTPDPLTGAPGRMSPTFAFSLILAGVAELLVRGRRRRRVLIAQGIALFLLVLAMLTLVGYAYGARGLYWIYPFTAVSLPSALGLGILSLGMLSLRPRIGLVGLVTDPSLGGRLARELLPAAIVLLFVLGLLRVAGERAELVDLSWGTASLVVAEIVLITALVIAYAAVLGRADRQRRYALASEHLARERFETTLTSIGDAVIATDSHGNVTFLNPVAEHLTGWSLDDASGHRIDKIFHIVDELTGEPAPHPVDRVIRENRVLKLASNTGLIARDGRRYTIEDAAAPICSTEGRLVGVVLVFRDVTEKRLADQAQRRLAAIVENSRDAILSKTLDGVITTWNPGAEHLYGYTAEEAVGKHITLIVPDDRADEIPGIMEALRRGELIADYETVRRRKDGSLVEVSATISPVIDETGNVVAVSAISRDITQRKQAERELQQLNETLEQRVARRTSQLAQSEKLYRTIGEEIDFGIWITGPSGGIRYLSQSFLDMAGITLDEAREYGWTERLALEDVQPMMNRWKETLKTGESWDHEHRIRGKDGQFHTILSRGRPIRDEHGHIAAWAGINLDITDRKRMEQRLHDLHSALEHRARQLQLLARQLSAAEHHERQRIAYRLHEDFQQILVAAKMALGRPGELAPDHVERTRDLIDQAIEASRNLAVELHPPVLYDRGLGAAFEWLAIHFEELYELNVVVQADERAEPDSAELRSFLFQAARELLINVVKHAGVDTAWLRLRSSGSHDHIQVEVEDHGPGCDVRRTGRTQDERQRFGLFSIDQRVRLLGGTFEIKSDDGCVVTLTVPRATTAPPATSRSAGWTDLPMTNLVRENGGGVVRVLLVDDHHMVRQAIAARLNEQSDIILAGEAADGLEAVNLATELQPDVVVLDVSMPGVDGVEAAQRILRALPRVCIIALSMHTDEQTRQAMLRAGARYYLTKDGPLDDLIIKLRRCSPRQPN